METKVNMNAPLLEEIEKFQNDVADFGNETNCQFTKGVYTLLGEQLYFLYGLVKFGIIEEEDGRENFRFLVKSFVAFQEEE